MKRTLSLKARALQWLSQREHSRVELRQKLLSRARAEGADDEATSETADAVANEIADEGPHKPARGLRSCSRREREPPVEERVESVLDWLEAHGYLNVERFAESRVHARQARFGNRRIAHELKQHGVTLEPAQVAALQASEAARARAARERKFRSAPTSPVERAKQARFLAVRGFSGAAIRAALKSATEESAEESSSEAPSSAC